MQAYDDGPITSVPDASDCTSSASCNPQAHDVIEFDDQVWPHDDPANTLALTTVTFGVDDGAIFEAYTEVNSTPSHPLTTQEPPPAGSNAYDLQAILTHEAGHFFGLAHATETTSVMYAYYKPGNVVLTPDDVAGFCAIYPQSARAASGGCATSPRAEGAGGAGALPAGLTRNGSTSGAATISGTPTAAAPTSPSRPRPPARRRCPSARFPPRGPT